MGDRALQMGITNYSNMALDVFCTKAQEMVQSIYALRATAFLLDLRSSGLSYKPYNSSPDDMGQNSGLDSFSVLEGRSPYPLDISKTAVNDQSLPTYCKPYYTKTTSRHLFQLLFMNN